MPTTYWIILLLVFFSAALFHTSYKLVRDAQSIRLSDVQRLLERRQTQGFDIHKKAKPGWEACADQWYKTVLQDLALIKGPDFSRLFDLDIGRKRSIKDDR
jgi:hypothetical protein